jgi:hypothetical protein
MTDLNPAGLLLPEFHEIKFANAKLSRPATGLLQIQSRLIQDGLSDSLGFMLIS